MFSVQFVESQNIMGPNSIYRKMGRAVAYSARPATTVMKPLLQPGTHSSQGPTPASASVSKQFTESRHHGLRDRKLSLS